MSSPLIDAISLLAIESHFHEVTDDPWFIQLAGAFADLFVYGDRIRYTYPNPDDPSQDPKAWQLPSLVKALINRDSEALYAEWYSTKEPRHLDDPYLEASFRAFAAWAKNNKQVLRQWTALHNACWLRNLYLTHVPKEYVFSLETLRSYPRLKLLSTETELSEKDLCYAFDIILKYPLFGALTGENEYYLNHPIRNAFSLPTQQFRPGPEPRVCITFAKDVAKMVKGLSQDEYTVLLHELRGVCRDRGFHLLKPGEVSQDVLREIAAELRFPPKLKDKVKIIGGGIIGSLAGLPVLGFAAPLLGSLVSVSTTLWKGKLPRAASEIRWLRWTYTWDIEEQAQK